MSMVAMHCSFLFYCFDLDIHLYMIEGVSIRKLI